jgi:hypothetical protein
MITLTAVVIGQISFGVISDKVGRKPGMFITTAIIFVFMILMAASAGPTPQVLINCLIAFRFFVGIGIGGEYPCGSTAAAEASENSTVKKGRQQRLFVWATHFIIDVGFREYNCYSADPSRRVVCPSGPALDLWHGSPQDRLARRARSRRHPPATSRVHPRLHGRAGGVPEELYEAR